ncbi:MAG: SatD family protein [Cyclobacteriaceae bacterium]
MKYVILMADIIGSSEYEGASLMDVFSAAVSRVNDRHRSCIRSPLTITLGDEFQGVVKDLPAAVDIIFDMDEQCLQMDPSFRLRYVIRLGEIDTVINHESSHGMLGAGLTAAREQLESMKKGDQEIAVRGFNSSACEELDLAFQLYRAFYSDWPEKDKTTALDFIRHRDYKTLAGMYGKDVSTMWRKERSLRMEDFYASRSLIKLLLRHA